MATPLRTQFAAKLPAALKSDKGQLDLTRFIKSSITSEPDLLACLSEYARGFSAANKKLGASEKHRGLAIGYTLFSRSIALAGPLNSLGDLVPRVSAVQPDRDPEYTLYAERWQQLPPADQKQLLELARVEERKRRARQTLITPLVAAYTRKEKRGPSLNELMFFDPAPDTPRKGFDEGMRACQAAWNAIKTGMKPTDDQLKAVDAAFTQFTTMLAREFTDPLRYFQMMKWFREAGGLQPAHKVGDKTRTPSGWTTLDLEIYLEIVFHAVKLGATQWKLQLVMDARALPTEDYTYFLAPVREPRLRRLFDGRVQLGFANVPAFIEVNQSRRRLDRHAHFLNAELMDEEEVVTLQNEIAKAQKANPDEVSKRYIQVASQQEVFRDRYRVNQTVLDQFTIIWLEPGEPAKVIVEFHNLDCVLFRTNAAGLDRMVRNAFFTQLALNAAALKGFLLAYLELIGLVVDVITAGAAGGFRRMAITFIKEKMKDKAVDKVLDAFHVENAAVRFAAGLGANAVHLPKGSTVKGLDELDLDAPRASAIKDKGTAGALSDPPIDEVARMRAKKASEKAQMEEARRAEIAEREMANEADIRMASGDRAGGGGAKIGTVRPDRAAATSGRFTGGRTGGSTASAPPPPKYRELPLTPGPVPELPHPPRALSNYSANELRDFFVRNAAQYPPHIRRMVDQLPAAGTRRVTRKSLDDIDAAIRQAHTNEANRLFQANGARQGTPFISSSRATANEGGMYASMTTDGKNLSLHGRLKSGDRTVEFDSAGIDGRVLTEVKMNLNFKSQDDVIDQMRKQAQFAQDWGFHVTWEVHMDVMRAHRAHRALSAENPHLGALIKVVDPTAAY